MLGNAHQVRNGFTGDSALTGRANAPVVGGAFVKIVPGGGALLPLVEPATATDRFVAGVAAWDVPVGEDVTFKDLSQVPHVRVGAAVAAGDPLRIGANGLLEPVPTAERATIDPALVRGIAYHAATAGSTVLLLSARR